MRSRARTDCGDTAGNAGPDLTASAGRPWAGGPSGAPAAQVDHCRRTGKVRGVLRFNCNTAIGLLGDDPGTIQRAISYLEGNAWKPTILAQGVYRQPS
ncbi:endonuclease domain-containing protein [Streptomyces sp. NPDC051578]|uniref:endonuclease domain-containing protein n=1 Tax=unclassified Streptomyces TaxID=2593676 RepID=UPI003435748D